MPSSRGSPDPGMEPDPLSPALAGRFFTTSATWEALVIKYPMYIQEESFKIPGQREFHLNLHDLPRVTRTAHLFWCFTT